jgi:hypothetical protein
VRLSTSESSSIARIPIAGLLAWILPGLGHLYLGYRQRGIILLVTIMVTFWSGVAIGGVKGTVDPSNRKAWFFAELCTGSHALVAWGWHKAVGLTPKAPDQRPMPYTGHWLRADVGIHYAGVAGLLNLLIILDAITRADPAHRKKPEGSPAPRGDP